MSTEPISPSGPAPLGGIPLVCSIDKQRLDPSGNLLTCPHQHRYPLVGEVAILLRPDVADSHPYLDESRRWAAARDPRDPGRWTHMSWKRIVDRFLIDPSDSRA